MGLAKQFKTTVSLRNDMTVNLDVDDGLVNGAVCVTKQTDISPVTTKPQTICVQFDDPEIGVKLRRECKHMYSSEIDKQCTPIHPVSREFQVGKYRNTKLRRTPFPLQLSCAKTIHKSHGQTYTKAALKLPDQKKDTHTLCSFQSCHKLNNLYVLNEFDPTFVGVCPKVQQEMQRMRTKGRLQLSFAGLGGSVGCAVRLETRRSRVQPPPRSATFFRGHALPSADSRRAVVSFWRKNVHNTG